MESFIRQLEIDNFKSIRPGARAGDILSISCSLNIEKCILAAQVTSNDIMIVSIYNPQSSSVSLGTGTFKILLMRLVK